MTIHLITAGNLENPNTWPELWHHCYNIWKSSPYEIKLWGDRDIDQLLKEDNEEFFNILNTLPPIYKWDYVRYLILEKFGGAYFDMDVEIVDGSFLGKLNPNKIYIMEGTTGSYIENSIMISTFNSIDRKIWKGIKTYSQTEILKALKTHDLKNDMGLVVDFVGADLLSKFILLQLKLFNVNCEILSYPQFGSLTNEISYTRHYQSSYWLKE